MPDTMRIAVGVPGNVTDDQLTLAAQMGCSGVVVASPSIPYERGWAYEDLARLRDRVAAQNIPGLHHSTQRMFNSRAPESKWQRTAG